MLGPIHVGPLHRVHKCTGQDQQSYRGCKPIRCLTSAFSPLSLLVGSTLGSMPTPAVLTHQSLPTGGSVLMGQSSSLGGKKEYLPEKASKVESFSLGEGLVVISA